MDLAPRTFFWFIHPEAPLPKEFYAKCVCKLQREVLFLVTTVCFFGQPLDPWKVSKYISIGPGKKWHDQTSHGKCLMGKAIIKYLMNLTKTNLQLFTLTCLSVYADDTLHCLTFPSPLRLLQPGLEELLGNNSLQAILRVSCT